jgi:hypothetical protein
MKHFLKIILIIIAAGFLLMGCYNDSEEYLYPSINNNCDTTNVTFSATIYPIITESCLNCHQGSSAGGNIDLTGYANVKIQADNGKLIGSVKQTSGFSSMPKGGSKLSDCKIDQIEIWIRKGTLNN